MLGSRITCTLILALGAGSTLHAADLQTVTPQEPLFTRHIVPLFSRLGCNAGVCHGAVKGQNGFRLSLFGVSPEQDRESLVREFNGRRLDFLDVDNSLLLLKAAGRLAHQGGKRTEPGRAYYQMMRSWIAQGAKLDDPAKSRVTRLTVEPKERVLKMGEKLQLKVSAQFADGTNEDVTSLATFETAHKEVADINASGEVEALGVGSTALVVRYAAEPMVAMILVPNPGSTPFPAVATHNFIDEHIVQKLKQLNIPPSDLCDDVTFLRRASLDVTGALPEPDEIRRFLADKSSGKRVKLIDDLLNRPGYSALWATKFCDILKANNYSGNFGFVEAAENRRFYEWLRARFGENLPYDQLVDRILTATSLEGRSFDDWIDEVMTMSAENAKDSSELTTYSKRKTLDLYWQRQESTGVKGTLQVAHAFLGLRLECAQCHRHPHDVWKQDDLLSFANFFTRVSGANYPNSKELPPKLAAMVKDQNEAKKLREQAKKLTDQLKNKKQSDAEGEKIRTQARELEIKARILTDGPKRFGTEIKIASKDSFASVTSPLGTQRSNELRLLGEEKSVKPAAGDDPRKIVMDWLRRGDNPFFARAIVNRVWAHYFGRGIIDPPDHLSPLNPPSHPELLDALAKGFTEHNFDLKWLHRTILNSRTYQLSCRPNDANRKDRQHYAYFYLRRLPAEVLVDAVNQATGGKEKYPGKLFLPENAKAIEVAGSLRSDNESASLLFAFQAFGRPLRNSQVQCDCERDTNTTIVQTLYLANHPAIRQKIASAEGRVAQIIKNISDADKRIEELFLWSVSRLPTDEERRRCIVYLEGSPSPQSGLEDVLWSLLNTREFILNH